MTTLLRRSSLLGERLQLGFFVRSFIQQQDHYPFYAFPGLDIPPGGISPDTTTDLIPFSRCFCGEEKAGQRVCAAKSAKAADPSVCKRELAGESGRK